MELKGAAAGGRSRSGQQRELEGAALPSSPASAPPVGKLEARRREIEARPAKGARGAADGPQGAPAEGAPWVAGGGRKGAAQGRGGDAWLACAHLSEVGFRRAGGRVPEGWGSGSGGLGVGFRRAGGRVPAVEKAVAVVVLSRWRKAGGRAPTGCGGARQRPSAVAFGQLLCFPFFRETESEPVRWGGGN
jgi:hypothetical protein